VGLLWLLSEHLVERLAHGEDALPDVGDHRPVRSREIGETGEEKRVTEQHLKYYATLAEKLETILRGPQQITLMEHLDAELDNIRLALKRDWEGRGKPNWAPEPGLRLVAALLQY
jgi:hypothetical protein